MGYCVIIPMIMIIIIAPINSNNNYKYCSIILILILILILLIIIIIIIAGVIVIIVIITILIIIAINCYYHYHYHRCYHSRSCSSSFTLRSMSHVSPSHTATRKPRSSRRSFVASKVLGLSGKLDGIWMGNWKMDGFWLEWPILNC